MLIAALHQAGLATLTHTPSLRRSGEDPFKVPALVRKPLDEILLEL